VSSRVITATGLGFREQARRPLLIVLLIVLPFFFITRASAATEASPHRIGLPGGAEVVTTMRDVHGALMAAITVAFLAGLCGVFIMRSARNADRRLVVAGFRPIEAVVPRFAVLVAATLIAVVVSLAVTELTFQPVSWPAFAAGTLLIGLTYACIGALAGALLGQLGATYLVLFLALLGMGILQNPMFGDGTPGGAALVFPDYGAARVIVDGGFAGSFDAWGELAMALGWLAILSAAVGSRLRRVLTTAR
jgi:hypothetical protein